MRHINETLQLHVKSVILARQDPFIVMPRSRFAETKFSNVIASACLSRMKKLINTSVWKYPWKYISIDGKFFYCVFCDAYDVNLRQKCLSIISLFYRNSHRRDSTKNILKNFAIITGKYLRWNLIAGLQFCNFMKKRLQHWNFHVNITNFFENTYFEENLRTTASYFMKKNRHSWRLNNSS